MSPRGSSGRESERSGGRSRRRLALLAGAALVASLLVLHLTSGGPIPSDADAADGTGPAGPGGEASARLQALFEEAWEARLEANPLFATQVGVHRYNHLLPTATVEHFEARRQRLQGFLERLRAIDREALQPRERVSYDVFERLTSDDLGEFAFRSYLIPMNGASGFHTELPQLPDQTPLRSVDDYRDYLSRLEGFLPYFRQQIGLMRTGIETGMVLPRVVIRGWEPQVEPHVVEDPEESLLYAPFEDFPDAVPAERREELAAAGRRAVETSVVPAYRELAEFLRTEYAPAARESLAASALPRGKDFYAHRVRRFTTLDLSPQQVHETGLGEVARIRREMEAVIEEVGFEGTFDGFVEMLRTDERFYADTPEELLEAVSWVLKRMDGKLPELFATLPRMPYGVKPVPDYLAPKIYTAYYEPPSGDGTRAGYYNVNTYDLPTRPLYEIEALSFHEAVPGHHLQIALQQEIDGLPPFRRFRRFDAFQEGWALYSERLGLEVGFYQDPYSEFGRLTYEMWRALRLVVDTGLHAFGWSRDRAIEYMAANSALSVHNIRTEVDRYIGWPGQALAYKTGELEIRRLRARAEEALGPDFDLRRFHDVVLEQGAVPLTVLADRVEGWIRAEGARGE